MNKFWELFQSSVITQSLITFALVVTLCYLFIAGRIVPDQLLALTYLVVGFWFGSKVGFAQSEKKQVLDATKAVSDGE